MNSNRFISRLMHQNFIAIIKVSALTFMPSTRTFDLIFYKSTCFFEILNCEGVLPEICIDMDVFFL